MSRVIKHINDDLHALMKEDKNVYIVGEDLLDPYGGAFKVTIGLSVEYPGRIISTPISEGLICGLIMGMAIEGLRPIGEIMFGDFLSLCFSQLLDNAAKYKKMFNMQIDYPFVIRTPMGGGRGYGATHSQSIEKYFSAMKGIKVIAINEIWDGLYLDCFTFSGEPIVLIENKLLYGKQSSSIEGLKNRGFSIVRNKRLYPSYYMSFENCSDDEITVITYGLNVSYLIELIEEIYLETETSIGLIIISDLSDFDVAFIENYICTKGQLFIVEDGEIQQGIGAELSAQLSSKIKNTVIRIGGKDLVIPSARQLEEKIIVTKNRLEKIIRRYLNE
jgi:pyruvate/2-oxoglutarate/acetoin dehydrogenase E1 component